MPCRTLIFLLCLLRLIKHGCFKDPNTAAKLTQHRETETAHTLCKQNTCFIQNGQSVHQNRVCTVELQSEYLVCLAMLPHHGSNFRKLENYCPRNLKQEKHHKEKGLKTIAQCTQWVMLSLVDLSKRESWFLSILFKCLKTKRKPELVFVYLDPQSRETVAVRAGEGGLKYLSFIFSISVVNTEVRQIWSLHWHKQAEVKCQLYMPHIY